MLPRILCLGMVFVLLASTTPDRIREQGSAQGSVATTVTPPTTGGAISMPSFVPANVDECYRCEPRNCDPTPGKPFPDGESCQFCVNHFSTTDQHQTLERDPEVEPTWDDGTDQAHHGQWFCRSCEDAHDSCGDFAAGGEQLLALALGRSRASHSLTDADGVLMSTLGKLASAGGLDLLPESQEVAWHGCAPDDGLQVLALTDAEYAKVSAAITELRETLLIDK